MNQSKESKNATVFGIAWYRPDQWPRVRDISVDPENLEDTYEEWVRLAEDKLQELRSSGLRVEKVDIDSEQLILWCNERGLEVNGEARANYAADKLRERDQPRSSAPRS